MTMEREWWCWYIQCRCCSVNLESAALSSGVLSLLPLGGREGCPPALLLVLHRVTHSAHHPAADAHKQPEEGPVQVLAQLRHRREPRPPELGLLRAVCVR